MQGDDPPYLTVGTAVSAKYKGAFCEAKVSKVVRIVKCKITFKTGLGTITVSDDAIRGTLRVGQVVSARHPERKDYIDATIAKIQDCSQYTVVFDDGDITTLRRSALCLKSGRHFNESETLDQLPLTHPEHFGNPVMGGRRGRRSRQLKEDSSDGEAEEVNEPDLELYSADIGRVCVVEGSDKKRNKDNWFPGLIVIPSAQPTVRINVKDEFLIRSFRDGRYYTVPKKEIIEFKRDSKADSPSLLEAIDKACKYLDTDELPAHWERSTLFSSSTQYSDSDCNYSDSSDDEQTEEKDHFVAQLYKFMDDSGTPLNKTPTIATKDVDFYKLFRLVHKFGGYNRTSNQNKWKAVAGRLKLPQNQNTYNQVKQVYKKCLLSYESFYRTLGCTMLNPTRATKKNRGRPLIRDKDRMTPVQSPKPEKTDEETAPTEPKKEEDIKKEKEDKEDVQKVQKVKKKVEEEKRVMKKEDNLNVSDNSSDATDLSEIAGPSNKECRPKRSEKKEKKIKLAEKVKAIVEKFEEQQPAKKSDDEKEKQQHTRSKSKDTVLDVRTIEIKPSVKEKDKEKEAKCATKPKKSLSDDDKEKKRGRKRLHPEESKEKPMIDALNETSSTLLTSGAVNIGDKLKVYYGPTHESKVTYEAKVIEIDKDPNGQHLYLVHYTGWNNRYDEYIGGGRIAENLSATTKAKKLKMGGSRSSPKVATKRGRGMSITGRSTMQETPRSTTPSSVTSSSSRTKSPATPLSRNRSTRRTRRTSDISTESDEERSGSDVELTRTRSGIKSEDGEKIAFKRKKEEGEEKPKRQRKFKKFEKDIKSDSEDEAGIMRVSPKGADFDLNQIRSELKGFSKPIKTQESVDKDAASSDDSSVNLETKSSETSEPEDKEKKDKQTSDDIYEFKEPEPFEFGSRKIADDKSKKRMRVFDEVEKSPPKKKASKSPVKQEKERVKKTNTATVKKLDEGENVEVKEEKKSDDPFDKLVESPSFHVGKTAIASPEKLAIVEKPKSEPEAALSIFDLPSFNEENSEDRLELSDNEERANELSFTRTSPLFTNFGKPSPDHIIEAACDSFPKDIIKQKDSEDEDDSNLQASIQRAESTLTSLLDSFPPDFTAPKIENTAESEEEDTIKDEEDIAEKKTLPKQIASVFQESDSSILKDLYAPPAKCDDIKEFNLKTGTKIADSILQKLTKQQDIIEAQMEVDAESKSETKVIKIIESSAAPMNKPVKTETKSISKVFSTNDDIKCKPEVKKRSYKKYVSPEFIEGFDSDSDSDSDHRLVIARTDESESNSSHSEKPMETKIVHMRDQQPAQLKTSEMHVEIKVEDVKTEDVEEECKDEEPDAQLHSMLLCEETIPGSPAPAPVNEHKCKTKTVMEMPFASAPSSSNNKSTIQQQLLQQEKLPSPAPIAPVLAKPRESNASAVMDNTPPTTPESTISNLSPRGDIEGLSPNHADNESGKSTEAEIDYTSQRRTAASKVTNYSEEDSLNCEPNTSTKKRDDVPLTCKKRRRSMKGENEMPARRGRKPNRSRHNSDSDDTSEHSIHGIMSALDVRLARSPRPSKYNFFVEFDPSLDSTARIAVLLQRLDDLRKTYADLKAELVTIERRRKKIRRREREALKAAKQEMAC